MCAAKKQDASAGLRVLNEVQETASRDPPSSSAELHVRSEDQARCQCRASCAQRGPSKMPVQSFMCVAEPNTNRSAKSRAHSESRNCTTRDPGPNPHVYSSFRKTPALSLTSKASPAKRKARSPACGAGELFDSREIFTGSLGSGALSKDFCMAKFYVCDRILLNWVG